MNIRRILLLYLAFVVTMIVWCVFPRYFYDWDKEIMLSNGQSVHAHLANVEKLDQGKVRITMELMYKPRRGERLVVPDMDITHPRARRGTFLYPERELESTKQSGKVQMDCLTNPGEWDEEGIHHVRNVAIFNLRDIDRGVDVVQPVLVRRPSDTVRVELPLHTDPKQPIMLKIGTAEIELLDVGTGDRYISENWRNVDGPGPFNDPPRGAYCVRVKQTDPTGLLFDWLTPDYPFGDSCTAELIGYQGDRLPMLTKYVNRSNCGRLQDTVRTSPSTWITDCFDVPGNGVWLYVFKMKNPSKFTKVRIQYVLPPKPKDKGVIYFKGVPI